MKTRLPAISLCLFVLFLSSVAAQTQKTVAPPAASPTPAPAPMPAQPPDSKAYDEARRIRDPQKKIDALEKVLKDYPDGFPAFQARSDVIDVLIKNFPTLTDRIRAAVERYLRPMNFITIGGGNNHVTVAVKLMDAGILLEWAEELAKKGVALFEEETAKSLRRQRARSQDALGRIYLKQGKTKLAKNHLKQALANDAEMVTTLVALGQIAEASGDHKAALEYLASAAVRSTLKKADRQHMESAYRARHDGSLTGLEELLDEKYRKLNAGLHFAHYQATSKRTNRVALAELFTGSGCGPCVAADLGFEGLLERYDRKDLVVLVYHLHIPLPDPMTNPAAVDRGKYYAVPGTPTPILDGFRLPSAGGSREMTKSFFERVNPKIEAALETPAQAQLTLTGSLEGDRVKTTVTVDEITAPSPDLKIQIVLAEGDLRYTGENGVRFHPMVVRSLGGKDASGFAVAATGPTKVEWSFDLKTMSDELKKYLDTYEQEGHRGDPFTFSEKKFQITPHNLSLIAFVQDMKTKNVLQTVYVKLNPTATASAQTNAK